MLLEIVGEEEAESKAAEPNLELDDLDFDKPRQKPADKKPAETPATGDTE